MNRRTIRAFALGILFSACAVSGIYYFTGIIPKTIDVGYAEKMLSEEGYTVLTESEHKTLIEKAEPEELAVQETKDKPDTQPEEKSVETAQQEKQEQPAVSVINITIESGMSPSEIAGILHQYNIIDDQGEFERYLIDTGFHTKIQLGTFELTDQMSFEQLAKVLTKS